MILDRIVAQKRRELVRAKARHTLAELHAAIATAPPVRDFASAIRRRGELSVIAEMKRASPAKGTLNGNLDPARLSKAYGAGGARALSVLTDEAFFRGSAADLRAARRSCLLPVLRKDFVIDERQLFETRLLPADAVLLIARILERRQLAEFVAISGELGLTPLVEVHSEREVEAALEAKAAVIGINNRDLDTLAVSLETTARLRPIIPPEVTVVSESGISRPEHVAFLRGLGLHAALIGEALVTSSDPERQLRFLLNTPLEASHG